MQNIIVDIGNTNVKLFLFERNNLIFKYSYPIFGGGIDEKTTNFLLSCNISNCIISCVNRENYEIFDFFIKNFNTTYFHSNMKLPIEICYKTPLTLGLDRIAAVSGAAVIFPDRNILIIDAGTAITYDILLKDRKYLGGNISPGISIRFKSLNTFTGKLPLLSIDYNNKGLYGDNTESAIQLGVQNGIVYEVMSTINAFKDIYEDLVVVFTGGDTFFFEKSLNICIFVEPNLVAIGLNKILEINV